MPGRVPDRAGPGKAEGGAESGNGRAESGTGLRDRCASAGRMLR
ncbi:hypothetical protein FHS43_003042 [Streptosporangium becharense]|uniref:Uncharacterized protein n=1 Tax=Streptosporangium becharense TaxID=1816182 RepID=A0A7W9ILM4_9ACTN|nr:hypothetical protein [Streptosporangium becharense]MBB5822413.1 hypothetical protein [Streptosporangium becharense]